jgi:galactokinase/mevalonate kinase-like predicted kinase
MSVTSSRRGKVNITLSKEGPHSLGTASSSSAFLAFSGAELWLEHGRSPDLDAVVARALLYERARANGRFVGAQDVAIEAHGGVGLVHTSASGSIRTERIPCDVTQISRQLLFAHDPVGQRHHAPELLEHLFGHRQAREFVRALSDQATQAGEALRGGDFPRFGHAMTRAGAIFDEWSGGLAISPAARQAICLLKEGLGPRFLGAKAPGAGHASSLMVLVDDGAAPAAREALRATGWTVEPVVVTGGLQFRQVRRGGLVRISAGQRLDAVGASDLGGDSSIREDGVCCGIAIEPRCVATLAFGRPARDRTRFRETD